MSLSILSSRQFFVKKQANILVQRSFSSCQSTWRDFVDSPVTTPRAPLEGIRVLDLTRVLGTIKDKIILNVLY
jgi:hypothetical protein